MRVPRRCSSALAYLADTADRERECRPDVAVVVDRYLLHLPVFLVDPEHVDRQQSKYCDREGGPQHHGFAEQQQFDNAARVVLMADLKFWPWYFHQRKRQHQRCQTDNRLRQDHGIQRPQQQQACCYTGDTRRGRLY